MTRREDIAGSTCTFLPQADDELERADSELETADSSQGGGSTESGSGSDPGTSDTGKLDKSPGGA
jgi:hypothetical protein